MWADYHTDLLAAGMSADEADKNIERNRAHLMNGDRPSPGQHILDVINDGAVVGTLWLGHLPSQGPDEWFVYDIVIDETLRGTGLGRANHDCRREVRHVTFRQIDLPLNVFGPEHRCAATVRIARLPGDVRVNVQRPRVVEACAITLSRFLRCSPNRRPRACGRAPTASFPHPRARRRAIET